MQKADKVNETGKTREPLRDVEGLWSTVVITSLWRGDLLKNNWYDDAIRNWEDTLWSAAGLRCYSSVGW